MNIFKSSESSILNAKRTNSLVMVAGLVAVLTGISVIFHYYLAVVFKLDYPYSTFLFIPTDVFNDYINMHRMMAGGASPYHTGYFFNSNYLPFANCFFQLFTLIENPKVGLMIFLGLFAVLYGVLLFYLYKTYYQGLFWHFLIIYLFSYPVLFSLDRANLELFMYLIIFAFVLLYSRGKYLGAAVLLSVATAFKLYPGIFFLLFLVDKRYKELGISILIAAGLSVIPLFLFSGGFVDNLHWMMAGFQDFNLRSEGCSGVQHNSTLFGLLKIVAGSITLVISRGNGSSGLGHSITAMDGWLSIPYLVLIAVLFIAVVLSIFRKDMPFESRFILLTVAMIIFPNVSYDYKLLYVLVAFHVILFSNAIRYKKWMYVILALLLVPKDYLIITHDVSIAVIVNPLLLIFLSIPLIVNLQEANK